MTHEERFQRRRQIALSVKNGNNIAEICKYYGCSVHTVRNACNEFNVKYPRINSCTRTLSFEILAKLQNTELNYAEIARQLDVSREHVRQIASRAKAAGMVLNACHVNTVG